MVFYHGGAFVIESAFTALYHAYLNGVAAKARMVAVSVEYRFGVEHRMPTAYNDSWRRRSIWVVARNAASGRSRGLRIGQPAPALRRRGQSLTPTSHTKWPCARGTQEGGGDRMAAQPSRALFSDPYFWGK
ncbi:unnamed protein product [Miscanthus lutarioriparius]|uniref:Alpha/beta hydrolase fold-3 domain-containing protein n=1 Tax=Miscanthus lutarioriparius TaxID=422564 RepID=A0A811SA85_9POAL|nr:unnamed protein product [Miscanthus lutarioriparius]